MKQTFTFFGCLFLPCTDAFSLVILNIWHPKQPKKRENLGRKNMIFRLSSVLNVSIPPSKVPNLNQIGL